MSYGTRLGLPRRDRGCRRGGRRGGAAQPRASAHRPAKLSGGAELPHPRARRQPARRRALPLRLLDVAGIRRAPGFERASRTSRSGPHAPSAGRIPSLRSRSARASSWSRSRAPASSASPTRRRSSCAQAPRCARLSGMHLFDQFVELGLGRVVDVPAHLRRLGAGRVLPVRPERDGRDHGRRSRELRRPELAARDPVREPGRGRRRQHLLRSRRLARRAQGEAPVRRRQRAGVHSSGPSASSRHEAST